MFKKKKIIIGAICAALLLAGGIATALFLTNGGSISNAQPGSIEWKKQQYGETCERGVTEGLYTNTTEYGICTRDLGYDIKSIEPSSTTDETATDDTDSTTSTAPSVSDEQLQDSKRVGCVSLRAVTLEDLIESNKQQGISETDTRISYKAGIAQCDTLGL